MNLIDNLQVQEKKVLVRVDFNVPMKNGTITDDARIKAAIPTIERLLEQSCSIILMSHLGRPQKDKTDDGMIKVEKYSLRPIAVHLSHLLQKEVKFCPEFVGSKAKEVCQNLVPGDILLLENTRFEKGEKKGDESLAKELASYADLYINDAFGAAHRAHVSTTTVTNYFASDEKAAGLLLQSEVVEGQNVLHQPKRPFLAIVGGAKVSDKINLLKNMVEKADHIIVGGGMAYTFIKAQGGEIGNSLVEEDKIALAKDILHEAMIHHTGFHLPEDSIIADEFSAEASTKVCRSNSIPSNWMGLDIGPKAIKHFNSIISACNTIVWNGPMGVFEMDAFSQGTFAIAQKVAMRTSEGGYSLVGGGDSANAIKQSGLIAKISHVSTGGGAMLELLEGKTLPGIAALQS